MTGGVLVVMTGVPGTGKSAIADGISRALGAPVFAVDRLEAALNRSGITRDHGAGSSRAAYEVIRSLVDSQLRAGQSAIADAMHARAEQREALRAIAAIHAVPVVVIATTCADRDLHRRRLERRRRDGVEGFLYAATWEQVEPRLDAYPVPPDADLVLDGADPLEGNVGQALALISASRQVP